MYNTSASLWTWIGGTKNDGQQGSFDTRGVPSPDNIPGARQNGVSWTDKQGNFWLFGGTGFSSNGDENDHDEAGILNDLWMFSPLTGAWTFVNGTPGLNEKGRYGTREQPSETNYPGARYSASGWRDEKGNLWLFGGRGYSSKKDITVLDDVWMYSPVEDTWAWIAGDKSGDREPVYGDKGTFDKNNTPGSRHGCISWTDNDGNFFLMGGGTVTDLFSDLWKFDRSNNQWAWVSGSTQRNKIPVVNFNGVPDVNAFPGAITLSATWVDDVGDMWLFGGNGYGGNAGSRSLNNLWKYSTAMNAWTFLKGDISTTPTTIYGTKGVPAHDNTPGGTANSMYWTDLQGNFWVFGGRNGSDLLDQVWKLSALCSEQITGSITPESATLCEGASQVLTASGGTSYEWRRNDVVINGESGATLTVTLPGNYSVIISKGECSAPALNEAIITTGANGVRYADISTVEKTPVRLSARNVGVTFLWTPATGLDHPNAASPMATLTHDQLYFVQIFTQEGCTVTDTQFVKVTTSSTNDKVVAVVPSAFAPNGNNVNDRLRPLGNLSKINFFRVFNRWGNLLYETNTLGEGWDGLYKGVMQPAETYFWTLSGVLSNGESVKTSGKTLLIR
jgi:gliding motility-associated-like protein